MSLCASIKRDVQKSKIKSLLQLILTILICLSLSVIILFTVYINVFPDSLKYSNHTTQLKPLEYVRSKAHDKFEDGKKHQLYKKYDVTQKKRCWKIRNIPEPTLIIRNPGGVGNQMFSYAVLFAIAKSNRRHACMTSLMTSHLTPYFNLSLPPLTDSQYKKAKWTPYGLTTNYHKHAAALRQITKKPYVEFVNHPESWKYFEKFHDSIRQEFKFYDNVTQKAKERILAAQTQLLFQPNQYKFQLSFEFPFIMTRQIGTTVGVHVRRGDYIAHSVALNISLPTMDYFEGAMYYFVKKYKNVIFIVISDDIPWCIKHFTPLMQSSAEPRLRIHFLNGTSTEDGGWDLAVLANCDHVITGLGTFGFWGGYLSGGEVIFCSDCYNPETRIMNHINDMDNFVLRSWIGFTRDGQQNSTRIKYRPPVKSLQKQRRKKVHFH